jgi:O-antigen/teichoic acid export membrane protein
VFANLLPKEVYGQYRFLLTALSILSITTLPGMGIALTRAVANQSHHTIWFALKARMRWGLVGTAFALLGAGYYLIAKDATLSLLFLALAIFIPLLDSAAIYSDYLTGHKDFKRMALYHTAQRIFSVTAVSLAVIYSGSLITILITYLVSMSLSFWVCLWRSTRKYPTINTPVDADAIPYGKKLSILSALRTGVSHLDKIILWYLAGPIQVAQLVIAYALPNEMLAAANHISKLALPKLSSRTPAELRKTLLRKVIIVTGAMIIFAGGYSLLAPLLFAVLLPQYTDTIFFSQVASLLVLVAPITLLTQYFYVTANTKTLFIIQGVEPIVLVILYVILIPLFGVTGAIVASLIRHAFTGTLVTILFLRDRRK